MFFFRTFISAVAGVIVFSAIVEIIAPDGELKKYVKLVLGMVVTVTLISPLGDISLKNITKNFIDYDKTLAVQQQKNFTEEENEKIIKLYKEKLEKKIYDELNKIVKHDIKVHTDINTENKDNFGEIKSIYVVVSQKKGFVDYADEIKELLRINFGISEERVRLKFVKG